MGQLEENDDAAPGIRIVAVQDHPVRAGGWMVSLDWLLGQEFLLTIPRESAGEVCPPAVTRSGWSGVRFG